MTTTQAYVNARVARDLAESLEVDCEVTTDSDEIVIDFGDGESRFTTLEDAIEAIRENAKH